MQLKFSLKYPILKTYTYTTPIEFIKSGVLLTAAGAGSVGIPS